MRERKKYKIGKAATNKTYDVIYLYTLIRK